MIGLYTAVYSLCNLLVILWRAGDLAVKHPMVATKTQDGTHCHIALMTNEVGLMSHLTSSEEHTTQSQYTSLPFGDLLSLYDR